MCLWDINGKLAGQPIHRLLGTCKDAVPAYSSTAYHATREEYAEEAVRFQQRGWTAHKLHPHGEPRADVEICAAVRDAVGDDMVLMLDSMWAYQYADALRVGRAIEELDFYWYEDPLVEEDLYSYVKLAQKLDIPIMSTEFAPGRFYGMAAWITRYATDILRGDVAVTGGITPLVRQCHLAEGFNMRCEIHHGGNSLNNVANLHVTMAVPNCEYYEFFPCTGANQLRPGGGYRGRRTRPGARPNRAGPRLPHRLGAAGTAAHGHGRIGRSRIRKSRVAVGRSSAAPRPSQGFTACAELRCRGHGENRRTQPAPGFAPPAARW